MLDVIDAEVRYGQALALHSASVTLREGEIVAVLGANGAGKSTLVNAIAGILRLSAGSVRVDGESIEAIPAHRFVEHGIAVVPEGRRMFTHLTVQQNLELGAYPHRRSKRHGETLARVRDLFPVLAERAGQRAGTLSGGQQQMVAIGRALMAEPRYLLMDEPSLGLAPIVVDDMFDLIRRVHETGVGILLVEQNVRRTLDVCQRGYVLEDGRLVMEGTREELLASDRVRQAYLAL